MSIMDYIDRDLVNFPVMAIIIFLFCIMLINCLEIGYKIQVGGFNIWKLANALHFEKAAVVTNTKACTSVGVKILKKGGSAADAAIAALLCEGLTNPQSMGLGGGFLLTIYSKNRGAAEVLNARECAPATAFKNMYGDPSDSAIEIGGLAAAVPGELRGYWELHRKYGVLEWRELFLPAIDMCRDGIYITEYTAAMLNRIENRIMNSPSLKSMFVNVETGKLYKSGEYMKRPKLAETLELIALKGPDVLYNGLLTENFIKDIQENGGIITKEDLQNYRPTWEKPLTTIIPNNLQVFTVPTPGSGEMLLTVLDVMSDLLTANPILFWHRMVEAWKFAFGIKTLLAGPKIGEQEKNAFIYSQSLVEDVKAAIDDTVTYNETAHYYGSFDNIFDGGTCHIGVLAPNGDAVAVTSTINLNLGAMFASESTGIILNNEMMDFAIPHHHPWKLNPANYIESLKQPMSSMSPTIIVNTNNNTVRLIIGGAGGPKIITSTLQVIARNLWLGENITTAVKAARLHHQLKPMQLEFENGFPSIVLKGLLEKGHCLKMLDTTTQVSNVISMPVYSCVNAISQENGEIFAIGDPRRGNFVDGF